MSPVAGQQDNLWKKQGHVTGPRWLPSGAVPAELLQGARIIFWEFSAERVRFKVTVGFSVES